MNTPVFQLGEHVAISPSTEFYQAFFPYPQGQVLIGVVCNIDTYYGHVLGYFVRLPNKPKSGNWFHAEELASAASAPGSVKPITYERWQQMSILEHWQYFEALQWLYNHPDQEPPIAPDDTGALRVYNELTGNFDGESTL